MSYLKAEECLPVELVKEIQKYIQGSQIYIPRIEQTRLSWGEKNGTREKIRARNEEIRQLKKEGWTINSLADEYHLSPDSIRKILYCQKENRVPRAS
ncbi:MAG: CD3324 family protein [Spirochaetales bacterium]|nr:CD3324 family protein [Spirochaetales bacterium]